LKIGLLQCDHVTEEMQPQHGDVPDLFKNLFNRVAPEVSLDIYDVTNGEYPDLTNNYAGFISSGSRYSVYDQDPWIIRFKEFVRELYHHNRKFVGICFGHQMIAEALGGKCAMSDHGWGVGIKEVTIQHSKPWMKPELESFRLIVSHLDQVIELPQNSEIIGKNDHCPCSVYTVGEHFLGIQGHPEFTPTFITDLMAHRLDRIGRNIVDEATATLTMPTDEAVVTRWMINFILHHN
jgi:GMP synthase-like glutamine amidotransferase